MKYLLLLIIFSCNKQKANPDPKEKAEKPAKTTEQKPDKCAINMAKLAMLSQEFTSIEGKITYDDYDTDCPTEEQLQEMQNAVTAGKNYDAEQKRKKAEERDKFEEDRLKFWAEKGKDRNVLFRKGLKCYICRSGNVQLCRQDKPEDLEEIGCLAR